MVIKSKIYDFLKKNIGEYIYGFEKNQLDVGLLSGHIELSNVNFRPEKVNELLVGLGFPIHIKAGLIGKLRFKCHYTSFLSSPVEIDLDELLLVFGPITHISKESHAIQLDEEAFMWQLEMEQQIEYYNKYKHKNKKLPYVYPDFSYFPQNSSGYSGENNEESNLNSKSIKNRKNSHQIDSISSKKNTEENSENHQNHSKKMKSYTDSTIKTPDQDKTPTNTSAYQQEKPKKQGFLEKYFTKVLKNLVLTIKSIHIRYEDETYPYEHPLAIGMSLAKLEVKNIPSEWGIQNNKIVKRQSRKNSTIKEIIFHTFGVYIYSMASVVIPTSLWEATISSEIGIFEAFPAYEVRDLIISQSEMLCNSNSSTLLTPTNGKICIVMHEEAPKLKAVGVIDKLQCRFTAAMAECIRNFFDYCTNVQIWPLISRHKPSERIPQRTENREHRKERRKRREIVRQWFQYAFAFVKTKKAAIEYVRERKKDRKYIEILENAEKIKEKIAEKRNKDLIEKPLAPSNPELSKVSSLFSINRQRKVPGISAMKLDEKLKDYNTKRSGLAIPQVKGGKRPYDGEKHYPEYLIDSELEFHLGRLSLELLDEDTNLSIDFIAFDSVISINTLIDEMTGAICIGEFSASIKDQNKNNQIIKCGSKRLDPRENYLPALNLKLVHRPAEILIPNDVYNCLNMYEFRCNVAPVNLTYMHNSLNHFLLIKETFELDKAFRENLNTQFIKAFITHCKKDSMPKIFGIDLKKLALSKKINKEIIEFQTSLEEKLKEISCAISPILFNFDLELEGGKINFYDFSPNIIMNLNFPKLRIEAGKTKELTFIEALGINFKTSNTPSNLYEFLTTIGNIFCEKLQHIKALTNFKNIS
jgi:Vacuolar sorting-associated protein 13, N-terminal/N-terminal region of Chorein or VPS13